MQDDHNFGALKEKEHLISDSSLMAQICQQDAQALGVLYDRYGTLVYTLALRITGNRVAADAVSMEVFQVCWQSADTFVGSDSAAWIIGITRQCALHKLRADDGRLTESRAMYENSLVLSDSGSSQKHLQARSMCAALSALPIKEREAIELAYYDGLSPTMIAIHLGEPLTTIKTYLRQGLGALHAQMCADMKELI